MYQSKGKETKIQSGRSHQNCSVKKVVSEISQNLQEKKQTPAQVFSCEFCEISNNTFFKKHLQATASVS